MDAAWTLAFRAGLLSELLCPEQLFRPPFWGWVGNALGKVVRCLRARPRAGDVPSVDGGVLARRAARSAAGEASSCPWRQASSGGCCFPHPPRTITGTLLKKKINATLCFMNLFRSTKSLVGPLIYTANALQTVSWGLQCTREEIVLGKA